MKLTGMSSFSQQLLHMICIRGRSFVPHESLEKVSQPLMTVMKVTVKDHDREGMRVTKGERSDFGTPVRSNGVT